MKALLILLLAIPALGAQPGKGTSSSQFLKIGTGARAEGMGGAFGGLADDVEALGYNPAGLGHQRRPQGVFSYEARFAGLRHQFAAASMPVLAFSKARVDKSAYGAVGLSVTSLSIEGIERRGVVETDAPTGVFSASDMALALSYGVRPGGGRLALGLTGRTISSRLDSTRGSGYGADLGLLWRGDQWTFGGGARHLGPGLKLGSESAPPPTAYFAGASYQATPRLLAAVELAKPRDAALGGSLGVEYRYVFAAKFAACARGGFSTLRSDAGALAGAAAGLGVTAGAVDVDLSFQPFGTLGSSFKTSVKVRF